MRYLSLSEVLKIHRRVIESSGGTSGIRDLGAIESALAQPRATFGGRDLYPGTTEKAGSQCRLPGLDDRIARSRSEAAWNRDAIRNQKLDCRAHK